MTIVEAAALGEVCQINPRSPRGSLPPRDTTVSFVAMADVDENLGDITNRQTRTIADVERGFTPFKEGDVLFAKITPCMENGKVAVARHLVNGCGFGSTEFYVLRPTDRVLAHYIYHFVRQETFRALCKANFSGSVGQQRVPKDFLSRVQLPIPPLDEQRRIVDILGHASSIRRLREQAQAKAREIIPALFLDMFGDPVTNPRGWHQAELGDLIAGFEGGKNIQAGSGASSLRILKVSSVTSGVFRPEESKPAPDRYEAPTEHYVRPGDLLFTRANTADLVGATALVEDVSPNTLLPDKIWRFRWLEPSPVLQLFLFHVLQNPSVRSILSEMATGTSSSMKNISQAKLKTLKTIVPPISLQKTFSKKAYGVLGVSSLVDFGVDKAEALNFSLFDKYF